ncbi:hypothetical protein CVT25_014717 [Psilocybe cyanescens]|uniref:Uncharacterized protein n=1 Tax=Psilocybe cyanescens TaxID=93625 RepID=A0A409WR38_PSICY|nr:hypothetical protein CVT25_014717 [Psilocybe cyanescens]
MTHISGLKSESQQGGGSCCNGNSTRGDIKTSVHVDDADPTSVIEVTREPRADATFGDNQV